MGSLPSPLHRDEIIAAQGSDSAFLRDIERAVQHIRGLPTMTVSASELSEHLGIPVVRAANVLFVLFATFRAGSLTASSLDPTEVVVSFNKGVDLTDKRARVTVMANVDAAAVVADADLAGTDANQPSARSLVPPPDFTLTVRNFRGLRDIKWRPKGVCLLAGANGSGKTSVLHALSFLRAAYLRGLGDAVSYVEGVGGFRNVDAPRDEKISFALRYGDLTWELFPRLESGGVNPLSEERLTHGGEILLERAPLRPTWYFRDKARHDSERDKRTCLRQAIDSGELPEAAPLVDVLTSIRTYSRYSLRAAHTPPATEANGYLEAILHPTGRNLVPVLSAWQSAPTKFKGNFRWVIETAMKALPQIFGGIEFLQVNSTIAAAFHRAGVSDPDHLLPLPVAADGLLVTLLHLTAVAGARDGGLVAIDEVENHLHPHAIRALLQALRERAEERALTIVLTTHSPVVMNRFHDEPEQIYVAEAGSPIRPLTEIRDPDWLAHFSLGGLYEDETFGAPPVT